MKRIRFTREQIVGILRGAEAGAQIRELSRQALNLQVLAEGSAD